MATTFSGTFKNKTIDSLTGRTSTTYAIRYVNPYSGAQAADPSVAPVGTFVFSAANTSIDLIAMSQPAAGVSTIPVSKAATAVNAVTITTARVYDSNQVALIDVVAGTSAGGGVGAVFPNLTSSAGVAFQLDAFSFAIPKTSGTIMLNSALANALVSAWCVTAANVAAGSSASINVYSGSAPASADLPATGTLLATFTTAASGASWNAASAGSAALVSPLSVNASNTGTAGYVRLVKGSYVLQGSVGTSGADFILNSTSLTSGVSVSLTDATISI